MSLKDAGYNKVKKRFRARFAVLYSIVTHAKQCTSYGSLIRHSEIILIIFEYDKQSHLCYASQIQHRRTYQLGLTQTYLYCRPLSDTSLQPRMSLYLPARAKASARVMVPRPARMP